MKFSVVNDYHLCNWALYQLVIQSFGISCKIKQKMMFHIQFPKLSCNNIWNCFIGETMVTISLYPLFFFDTCFCNITVSTHFVNQISTATQLKYGRNYFNAVLWEDSSWLLDFDTTKFYRTYSGILIQILKMSHNY